MIKKTVLGLVALTALWLALPYPAAAITISYQAIDLDDPDPTTQDRWQYQYQVSQFDFPQDWGFDIFFLLAEGYQPDDLLKPLPPNPDWDVLLLKPDPGLPDNSRYDAVALVSNPSLNDCFTQTVIWRRQGTTPGAQQFEVFDAAFQVRESGTTVLANFTCPAVEAPEPGMLWLLGLGLLGLAWSRTKQS